MKRILTVIRVILWVALSISGSMSVSVSASTTPAPESRVEVVQSVPLETGLEIPGIRQTQQVWLEMIQGARSTIDLEEFYVFSKPTEALEPVLSALRAAASRGVQVRLLVDRKFYKNYFQDPGSLSRFPHIQVRTIDFASGVQHAKYFVVDRSQVYLGSANFDWLALRHIHEIGLHIDGPSVGQSLESLFEKDWETGIALQDTGQVIQDVGLPVQKEASLDRGIQATLPFPATTLSGLRVVASPPFRNPEGMPDTQTAIIELLGVGTKAIKIQIYQYSTKSPQGSKRWMALDAAIRGAARRGVKVQLMVDAIALKSGRTELASLGSLNNIEVRTVSLPEWSGGHLDYARLIHSKYFTVDGSSAWVGTENWSEGYFTGSRNAGVILQSTEIAGQLDQVFKRIWESPYASPLQSSD